MKRSPSAYISPHVAPRQHSNDYWGMDDMPFISRYDGLVHFRPNALGAFCLGLTEPYKPPQVVSKTQLGIKPNGTTSPSLP